jgi:hypothetical protein
MLKKVKISKPNLNLGILKSNLLKSDRLRLNRFAGTVFSVWLLLNTAIAALALYKGTIYFNLSFLKFNVIQLIIILLAGGIVFYNSHRVFMKNKPDKLTWFVYILAVLVFTFNLISMNVLVERFMGKGIFSISNYIFIFMTLIPMLLIISNYDYPLIGNLAKFYTAFRDNVYKNLGLILFILFVVAFGGLMNSTYVYVLSIIPFILNVYLIKTLLSNVRK